MSRVRDRVKRALRKQEFLERQPGICKLCHRALDPIDKVQQKHKLCDGGDKPATSCLIYTWECGDIELDLQRSYG